MAAKRVVTSRQDDYRVAHPADGRNQLPLRFVLACGALLLVLIGVFVGIVTLISAKPSNSTIEGAAQMWVQGMTDGDLELLQRANRPEHKRLARLFLRRYAPFFDGRRVADFNIAVDNDGYYRADGYYFGTVLFTSKHSRDWWHKLYMVQIDGNWYFAGLRASPSALESALSSVRGRGIRSLFYNQ